MATWIQCIFWINLVLLHTSVNSQRQQKFSNYEPYPENYQTYRTNSYQKRRIDDYSGVNFRQERDHANERSIPFTSNVQRVQDNEKKRVEARVADPAARVENGSYKIINFHKPVVKRRGQVEDEKVGGSVVFPGPTTKLSVGSRIQPLNIPESCAKIGICEDIPGYPEELVNELVEKLGEGRSRFKIDEIEVPEISQRIGPPEEEELCTFQEKVMIPRAAPDKDGQWYYIVNQKQYALQGVRVEVCRQNRSPCNKKIASFPAKIGAMCKQKYALRYLSAVDAAGNIIERSFKIPSCCSCVVRPID